MKSAPGWGEITFFNSFEDSNLSLRDYLLGWLFAIIEKHYSFALVLSQKGFEKFNYDLFNELRLYSIKKMKQEMYQLKFLPSVISYIKKVFFR